MYVLSVADIVAFERHGVADAMHCTPGGSGSPW